MNLFEARVFLIICNGNLLGINEKKIFKATLITADQRGLDSLRCNGQNLHSGVKLGKFTSFQLVKRRSLWSYEEYKLTVLLMIGIMFVKAFDM